MQAGAEHFEAEIVSERLGDLAIHEVVPAGIGPDDSTRAILYIHGGAFIHGEGIASAYMAMPLACKAGIRALCVDYRMPPYHPFPTGLDDCVAAYRKAIERFQPEHIAVAGGSAGGGLTLSLVLKLRDLGLPLPGACAIATPCADLTLAGDTIETNRYSDVVLAEPIAAPLELYADGHDPTDPLLSPVFADFGKGFPPSILTSGTRDALLSDTVRIHRALRSAGIEAELHVWEAMPHGGFFGAPEDQEVFAEQAQFIRKQLSLSDLAQVTT
ncbi:MAG: alpha/beta hydrolase fold domain-containing protein [Novosphingobium sp.]|nr:alpha/beta hydrolase fold domain-containing protein [Novosphingobium sp.]